VVLGFNERCTPREFDYAVEYKLGRMHLQADHLSRLSKQLGASPIDDKFVDENIFVLIIHPEW
jgi:hypothetical protein